ncbi:hypothetical protein CYMTET_14757 [Cymbomonas tetramitiformis]|uniref:Uncharacterized protein n=1 Tax=Cymbomonas tetramitiformis TaxID=36881 RepID=A0AAE0GFY9_9CHLO|nr:hypothetical protein CYMTET_14757 [Cymbomonas tetramitiformis]|eukprot:gene9784-11593_t
MRGLGTKAKKLGRLILTLQADNAGEVPAVRGERTAPKEGGKRTRKEAPPVARKKSLSGQGRRVRAASTSSECDSESSSESDRDELEVDLVTRSQARQAAARKRRENKQQNPVVAPSSAPIGDEHASDDTHDTDMDESLSDRRMCLAKEDLSADYTFEDMPVGSYEVTVAGGDETDTCWFDVMRAPGRW